MVRQIVSVSLARGLLAGCAVSPATYKIGTKNGEDYYAFDVNGPSKKAYDTQLDHWGTQFCPQGYRVVDSTLELQRMSAMHMDRWYKVTIACPAR